MKTVKLATELDEAAAEILASKIKQSTRIKYEKCWTQLEKYLETNATGTKLTRDVLTETLCLNYLASLSQQVLPSSLWSTFSALKCLAKEKFDLDLDSFTRVNTLLSSIDKNSNHIPKKAKEFTEEELMRALLL